MISIYNHLVDPREASPTGGDQYLDVPSDGCQVLMSGDSYYNAIGYSSFTITGVTRRTMALSGREGPIVEITRQSVSHVHQIGLQM